MPARPVANHGPVLIFGCPAVDETLLVTPADGEEPGQREFPAGPFGQMTSPIAGPATAVIPSCGYHGLPLLAGERFGNQACPPDALLKAVGVAALHLQDNRIIRILAASDYFYRPDPEVEGVVTHCGLQPLDQPPPDSPQPGQYPGNEGWHSSAQGDPDACEQPSDEVVHLAKLVRIGSGE